MPCSPPRSPAVLFSTVVLATRRVLSNCTFMPPPESEAVLLTTREPSTMIPTRAPYIPPGESATRMSYHGTIQQSFERASVRSTQIFSSVSPPLAGKRPALLFSIVVLVTRRVLDVLLPTSSMYMPPPLFVAVLFTTLEPSMMILARSVPYIPPVHPKRHLMT